METRSRKRAAEATSRLPSPATPSRSPKSPRVSSPKSNSLSASPRSRPCTRSTAAANPAVPPVIVVPAAASGSSKMNWARNLCAASGSKRAHEKSVIEEPQKEDERVTDRENKEKEVDKRKEKEPAMEEPEKEDERIADRENEEREVDKGKKEEPALGEPHRGDEVATDKESNEREVDKGKEKEPEKGKDEGHSRGGTAAAGSGGGDGDNDAEMDNFLRQNLASASREELVRKLGKTLADLLPSSAPTSQENSRWKEILTGLCAEGEEGRQLDSLYQLCELLLIGTQGSLRSFSIDSFVPVLVGLLNYEHNPDMMLLAARALTHLCDVLPSSCREVVHYGAVPCFCGRLLTIEYIDLAEQSLQALEKISHEHPVVCLRAGALIAVLSYMDFFSTGVQRVAVSTARNICRKLPSDTADLVMGAVPILTNLLQYQDSKVVEHASVCLTRIAVAFAASPEKIDTLCSHGLIIQAILLISVGNSSGGFVPQTSLSTSTYTELIRLLSTCAKGSAAAAESLLLFRISDILKHILSGAGLVSGTSVAPSSVNRPPDQLYEIVTLVNELLPPVPESSGKSVGSALNGISALRIAGRKYSEVVNSTTSEEIGQGPSGDVGPREKLLRDQPELLMQFGVDLFPVLVQVYGSSVNLPVRQKCLAAINKLLHFSAPDMLRSLLKESHVSSFLAGVIASKDAPILLTALQIAETLMQKLRDVFAKMFVKEGLVHAIDVLIASEDSIKSPPAPGRSGDASTSGANGALAPPHDQRSGCGESARGRCSGNNNDPPSVKDGGGSGATPLELPTPGTSAEPVLQTLTLSSGHRAAAIGAAKLFKESYFSGDSSLAYGGETESLCKLKTLCAKLNGEGKGKVKGKVKRKGNGNGKAKIAVATASNEDELAELISEILAELGGEDGVSTFEFVGSGVIGSLLNYFAVGKILKDDLSDPNAHKLRQVTVRRFKQFVELSLPLASDGEKAPLTLLVKKLQNALASLERFPVVLSHTPGTSSGSASIAVGLSALTQPFKLRLSRASGETGLTDYSKIVQVEPLATLAAIEDFLWPHVKPDDLVLASTTVRTSDATHNSTASPAPNPSKTVPASVELRPSTRSRSAAGSTTDFVKKEIERINITSAKDKGKTVSRGAVDNAVHLGPETRSAAARNSAAAVGASAAKQAIQGNEGIGVPSESENEDLDARKELERTTIISAKEKGKGVSRGTTDSRDEHLGPETRSAAARRSAASVGASAAKQANQSIGAPCKSKDEDLYASPVKIEEAVSMEDDDDLSVEDDDDEDYDDQEELFGAEPASVPIEVRVHDVQLGNGQDVGTMASTSVPTVKLVSQSSGFSTGLARVSPDEKGSLLNRSEAANIKTGVPLGTTDSQSHAAAAKAGIPSASGNGSRIGLHVSPANSPPKLKFSLGAKPLDRSLTIFQAIQRQAVAIDDEEEEKYADPDHPLSGGRRFWDKAYTISYERADSSADQPPSSISTVSPSTVSEGQGQAIHASGPEGSWKNGSRLDSILAGELPCDLEKTNPTYDILLLLRILEGLNHLAPRLRSELALEAFAKGVVDNLDGRQVLGPLVPAEEFLSSKLTPKLDRQMQDALALCSGGLPAWCRQLTRACPFLFSFETRRQYFHSTAFGLSRALQRLQQQQSVDGSAHNRERDLRVSRLQRQKVRVPRTHILDSATKVMELFASHKVVLEIEYAGEVGTGLGPTLEFYTLLSHELQRSSLEMWRTDWRTVDTQNSAEMSGADGGGVDDSYSAVGVNNASVDSAKDEAYVRAPQGLFPRPWPPGADKSATGKYGKVIEHFRLLGRVMAKALQDGRMLDLPLSSAFYKLVLGQELDSYDIKSIDPDLGRSLQEMQFLVHRKHFLESTGSDERQAIEALRFRDSKVEDLCLDFTLPGFPEHNLKPGGSENMVDLDNLVEYVSLVVGATVKTGISAQLEAFRAGFNQVFQLSTLQIFNVDELDSLLCGRRELWMPETMSDALKFDHGYTASSPPIQNLLELMGEFSPDEQRAFLRFVTGAPRLPPGGLSTLNPKLTIVRKHPTGVNSAGTSTLGTTPSGAGSGSGTTLADGDLPSVMTCANYLKLPPYSSKEVMRERLMYAIREGQGSFDLS